MVFLSIDIKLKWLNIVIFHADQPTKEIKIIPAIGNVCGKSGTRQVSPLRFYLKRFLRSSLNGNANMASMTSCACS